MAWRAQSRTAICTLLFINILASSVAEDSSEHGGRECNRTIFINNTEVISFQPGCTATNWLIVKQTSSDDPTTLRADLTSLELTSPEAFIVVTDTTSSWIFSQQSLNSLGDYMITDGNFTLTAQIPKNSPSTFALTVFIQRFGGNLKAEESFLYPPTSQPWKQSHDTYWTISVKEDEQAVLVWNTSRTKLLGNSELCIYEGHNNFEKSLLANFTQMSPVAQVFSQSNKMLVVAKGFSKRSCFQADIHQTPTGTNVISCGSSALFSVSSPINRETRSWIIKEKSEYISLAINQAHILPGTEVNFYKSLFNYGKPFFTLNTSLPSARTLILPTNNGLRVDYMSQASTAALKILFSSFYDISTDCEALYNVSNANDEPHAFTSPGYPNVYPFGTTCHWTVSTDLKRLVHIHFTEMDLVDEHTFTVNAWAKGVHSLSLTMKGSSVPPDLVLHASMVEFTLNTSSLDHILDIPHKGFMLSVDMLACGDNFTLPLNKFDVPGDVERTTKFSCLWYIELPRQPGEVNNINLVIQSNDTKADGSELKLFDGDHMLDASIVLDFVNGSATLQTKTNHIVLSYTFDTETNATASYSVQYSTHDCDLAHQCDNREFCMQDEWKCSGVDECGDWSDEKDCATLHECDIFTVSGSKTFSVNSSETPLACSYQFKASQSGNILVASIQDVNLYHPLDSLTFMDDTNTSDPILSINKENRKELSESIIITNTSSLWVSYFSFRPINGSTWTLDVFEHPVGGRYSTSGHFNIPQTTVGTVYFALQSEDMNQNVQIQNFQWTNESFPLAKISFYDGFSINQVPLAVFRLKDPPFDVFSITDKMLVVADNFQTTSASLSFISVQSESNAVTNGKSGSFYVAPPINKETRSWLVNVTDAIVSLTINHANLEPDSRLMLYKGLSYKNPPFLNITSQLLSARTLFVQVDSGLRVDYMSQGTVSTKQILFSASYEAIPGCGSDYHMAKDGQQLIRSPGYPNVYPFGSNCKWNMTTDSLALVHISFNDLDLEDAHTLNIEAFQNTNLSMNYTLKGKEVPSDLVFQASKVQFILDTTNLNKFSNSPPKGFVLNITTHEYGNNYENSSATFNLPGHLKIGSEVSGLWSIGQSLEESKVSNIVVNIKSNDTKAKGEELTLFDGPNLQESAKVPHLNFSNGVAKLTTKYSRLFILYSVKKVANTTAHYTVDYTIHECDTYHQCDNGKICMQDQWKCNGINECGDGSDEKDCLNVTVYKKQVVNGTLPFVPPPLDERYTQASQWQFETATANNILVATLPKVVLRHPMDSLIFRDGSATSAPILIINHENQDLKGRIIVTNTSSLWVSFLSFIPQNGSTWKLDITEHSVGGFFYSNSSHLNITNSANGKQFFTLQAKDGNQVQIKKFSWVGHTTLPASEVLFYEGFSINQVPLARFHSSVEPFDVFSMTDKMLVVADNFNDVMSASMSFVSIPSGHHRVDQSDSKALQLSLTTPGKTVWLIMPRQKEDDNGVIALTMDSIQLLSPNSSVTVQLGPQENAHTLITFPSIVNGPEIIHVRANIGVRVTIHNLQHSGDASFNALNGPNATAHFNAHYETVPSIGPPHNLTHSGEEFQVTSPGYPNLYPLNADCTWHIYYPNYRVVLTFADLDLHEGHTLHLVQFNNSLKIGTFKFSGNNLPEDVILEGDEVHILWASSLGENSSRTAGKGFNMTLRALDCGDMLDSGSSAFTTPGFPHLNQSLECVWIIAGANQTNINFTLQQVDFSMLKIHDGGSLRDEIITNTSHSMVSSFEKLLFRFKYEHANTSATGLSVRYHIEKCAQFCNNSRCLHQDWLCDGINHCGDNTDELNCGPNKVPAPTPSPTGVSRAWLAGSIVMGLIAGAVLGIMIPIVYKKVASRKSGEGYQRFDSSVNAS